MILVRSPLRVSFLGGMSDIPNHYNEFGGAVLSTAIDKYVYVSVMRTPQRHIKITYSKQELVTKVDDIQNEIVKNCLKYYEIVSNVEITTFADIPTVGSGLAGSSESTFI
jgi:D-glycero-alpha-D-manno-heptose-7-phosphate kinase